MTSPPSEVSPHLTVKQLAARWHTTPAAIYIARHRGKAPQGFRRGSRVLFPLAEVERFEKQEMAVDRPSHRRTAYEHRPPEPLRGRPRRPAATRA
ncbi:DNA-binding protein [Streptomyces mexicanus]|uniref:DNA-binding protein n=1 Tax=Streptomyces mexicanus TaxID=178566 RepID=UPI00365A826F